MVFEDESEQWFRDIFEHHEEEARQRAFNLLQGGIRIETGCLVTPTTAPRKVTFRGRQLYAYRFIHCILSREAASRDLVVRHRCANRLCINPDHLELGTQADNKRDDWEHWAEGIDFDLL